MTERELHDINDVFVRVSKESNLPIQHGLVLRERMWARLNSNTAPGGYRYEWLLGVAKKLIRLMGKESENFNAAHLGDQASVEDLKDMLRFALAMLEKDSGAKS